MGPLSDAALSPATSTPEDPHSSRPSQAPCPQSTSTEPAWTRLLAAGVLVAVGAWLRAPWALREHGLYWPDEIHQSLEPAHRWVYGYGLRAWEYIDGARTWLMPALLAAPLKLAHLVGLDAPTQYLAVVRALLCALALATGVATLELGRKLGARMLPAAVGAALFLWSGPALYFSHRALSETLSAFPVTLGLWLALPEGASRTERRWGAALLGLSVFLRLQNGVFCAALLAVLLARRAFRPLGESAGVLALCALGLGVFDWVTWGQLFHSARVYLAFNVLQDGASAWGTASWRYYVDHLLLTSGTGPGLLLLGLAGVGCLTRTGRTLGSVTAAFIAVHLLVPHKELRFLFPALPLLGALAGVGAQRLCAGAPFAERLLAVLALLALLVNAATLPRLTMGDVGQYVDERPQVPAFGDGADVNRLLLRAHTLPDLCGLKIEAQHLAWTGGYTYLHRNVPLYSHLGPARASGVYNHVLTRAVPHATGVVASSGPLILQRIGDGCVPDPTFSDRLP